MPDAAAVFVLLRPGVLAIVVALLGIVSLCDIAVRTIPDLASFALGVIGIAARLADGNAPMALAASTAVFVLAALCWRLGWLGGGDVKLLAASAWLVRPVQVPQLLLMTALAGGVLAGLYLTLGRLAGPSRAHGRIGRPLTLAVRIWRVESWRIRRRGALPYGCAITSATLFMLFGS
jgi:prepilin peptidase CpaA